jgi:hypothetical protein
MTLLDERIHVAIKSYGRAGRVKTLQVAPFAWVWVPQSQRADYERCYPGRVVAIPDAADGNLCRKSNAILDRSPCPWTLILDDDIPAIGYWEAGLRVWCDPTHLAAVIEHHFRLAHDLGARLWGINQNSDEMVYHTNSPFSLLAPVLGPFNGHLSPELRYDERMLGKDDYDFWLQNILRYRKTLRANKYHYRHDHGKAPGGFVRLRTREVEAAGVRAMRAKWGRLFKPGGSKGGRSATGKNVLNSIVQVPIKGC